MLYFGYGMNTNVASMQDRCPGAESLGHAVLPEHEFSFRIFADVVPNSEKSVQGVLWHINADHLSSLDALEGYPVMYDRSIVPVQHNGQIVYAWAYYMSTYSRWGAPSEGYVQILRDGYAAHGVPQDQIDVALREYQSYEHNYRGA